MEQGNGMEQRKGTEPRIMDEQRKYACWFYGVPGIGSRTMEKIMGVCPDLREFYRAGEKLWRRILNERQFEQLRQYAGEISPERSYEHMAELGIRFVTRSDADYPERLREIPDPPYALFVKGRLPDEEVPAVAVVGARDGSEYGRFVASGIGRALGESGIQVVSGMARGIDGISQMAALEAGGSSFGVLGCGPDICYPASNQRLYDRLCGQGGILSPYPPGTQAGPGHFPPRNRIVSGLSDALIVVEARNKSGTLITVDMALEQGRDVYAVPGRVTDRLSDGCNNLIKQGAGVFLEPAEFIRELLESRRIQGGRIRGGQAQDCRTQGEQAQGSRGGAALQKGGNSADPGLEKLRRVLDFSPQSVEEIGRRLDESADMRPDMQTLGVMLMRLCLTGEAVQVSPGHFRLGRSG
ncbi:MAG: DNA-processing protein DprA [Clostridium sp.]|nr:DNA-processing protein DprA [Acetatifactor muris]MCM1526047.1 DNA-processing protein DprA [Bacteroides sp.]MCM1562193.1 DNA-processing protein DprA [Clostridium sp.]